MKTCHQCCDHHVTTSHNGFWSMVLRLTPNINEEHRQVETAWTHVVIPVIQILHSRLWPQTCLLPQRWRLNSFLVPPGDFIGIILTDFLNVHYVAY